MVLIRSPSRKVEKKKKEEDNVSEFDLCLLIEQLVVLSQINKKYNCSGTPAFKSQRVEYQSDQKLLRHYQHSLNQLNSYIHSQDTENFRVS